MAHASCKHMEVERVQTTDTKRQSTTTQPQILCTYISPELELFFLHPASSSTGKEMSFVLLSLRKCAFACFSEEQNSAGTLKQVSFSPMPFIHVQAFPCVSKYGPLFTISL